MVFLSTIKIQGFILFFIFFIFFRFTEKMELRFLDSIGLQRTQVFITFMVRNGGKLFMLILYSNSFKERSVYVFFSFKPKSRVSGI